MVFVLRVFLIAIDGAVGGGLAGFPFDANGRFLLAAQVAQIPLVHDVEEGRKLVAVLVITVHAVGNGNKVRHQLLPCRPFKIAAAPAVIGIVAAVGVASLLGIAFEVFFLIHDGVAITGIVIVTA